jgi:membrane-bound ClpP family serine protease
MLFELFGVTVSVISIVLFAAGMILLLIEMFLPGFGIFGGLGLLCLALCIVFSASSVESALLMVLIIGAIVTLMLLLIGRSFRKGRLYRSSIVLKESQQKSEGFVSGEDNSALQGKKGVSLTVLRPAGIAEIEGKKADVVTEGEYIPKGAEIEVSSVSGRRIVVKKAAVSSAGANVSENPDNTIDI